MTNKLYPITVGHSSEGEWVIDDHEDGQPYLTCGDITIDPSPFYDPQGPMVYVEDGRSKQFVWFNVPLKALKTWISEYERLNGVVK